MTVSDCPWEKIDKFVSPGELNRFLIWMQDQISAGISIEVTAIPERQLIMNERWFKHVTSGAMWRLVPNDGPLAPGFWPFGDEITPN
jgi:hypothetical protein